MRRPALFTALCFATGLWVGSVCRPETGLGLAVQSSLLILAVLGILTDRFGWTGQILIAAAVFSCGVARHQWETRPGPAGSARKAVFDRETRLTGVIVDEPLQREDTLQATIRLESQSLDSLDLPSSGRVILRLRAVGVDLRYGDRIQVPGVIHPPRPPTNPGAFDGRAYAQYRGVLGSVFLPDTLGLRVLARDQGHPLASVVVLPVRTAIRRTIDRDLSGPAAALLKGILLGDRQAFPPALLEDFRLTGLTHTLAVSGFNVGIVALVGFTLLRALSFGRLLSAFGVMAFLGLYAFVTGLSPSVVRATVMACGLITGGAIERDTDALNSLGLAAFVLLVIWPLSLFDPGFQLSFAATASLMVLSRQLIGLLPAKSNEPWYRPRRWLWPAVAASLAAQAGSIPVMAYHFQTLSLVSLVANLPAAPLVSAATVLGVIAAMAGPLLPPMAYLVDSANLVILNLLLATVHFFAGWPGASIPVARPSLLMVAAFYLLVCLVLPAIRRSRWVRPILFALLLVGNAIAWGGLSSPEPHLEVVFLDVGQGDSAFLRFPDGKTMLVDGGMRGGRFDAGRQVVLPFLLARGIDRVDVVVASHPHDDHIGGFVEVLRRLRVGCYLDNGQVSSSRATREIREIVARKKVRYAAVSAGDTLIGLGGVGGIVLHPGPAFVSRDTADGRRANLNEGSVVLRLTYRNVAILMVGDAERGAEESLRLWGSRLRSDLIKVGHHGSKTSSSIGFLADVSPRFAVISVGERNHFGHPSPEILERYKGIVQGCFRTDRNGAVTAAIDREGLRMASMLSEGSPR